MAAVNIEKILKLPTPQKAGIIVAIIVVFFVLYYFLIDKPARAELASKEQERIKLQAESDEQQKILANLPKFKQELKDLQVQFEESLKLLPNTREIPNLLSNISSLAHNSGLEIMLFQPKPEKEQDFYANIPVAMKVRGKYHDFGYFCDKVSKLDRIVNINDIQLSSKSTRKNTEPGILEAKFSATTFKFIEKAKKRGKKKRRR